MQHVSCTSTDCCTPAADLRGWICCAEASLELHLSYGMTFGGPAADEDDQQSLKMTSRVLLPMYTDHQSVTAETLDCRNIFHREPSRVQGKGLKHGEASGY